MKVILNKDVENLGSFGDIIEVKDGYARNFLIPRKIVMPLTKGNLKILEEEKKRENAKKDKDRKIAQELAQKLEKVSITAQVTVGEEDRVFGSVTPQTISNLLKEKGFDIDKKKILLDEPIKALGIYTVKLKLHPEVEGKIKVWVVKE
ncbi:50S ribosomal protein L9 [candidate division KSB1 bacterium]|nr:MAG: 50S ribosomal protein L9 [candidate division KSB1 bacterium]